MREWNADEPLLSPVRLFNAVRLFVYFVYHEPVRFYPLIFYLKWYRRKGERYRKLGY